MYCSKCGKKISEDRLYCWSCSSKNSDIGENKDEVETSPKDDMNIITIDEEIKKEFSDQLSHVISISETEERVKIGNPDEMLREPSGIGGWLLLILFGQIKAIFLNICSVIDYITILNSGTALYLMDKASDTYNSSAVILFWVELLGTGMAVLLSICILITLFKKMKIFRALMFVYFIYSFVLSFLMAGITTTIPEWVYDGGISSIVSEFIVAGIGQMLSLAVWGAYLLKSKRVKNTFGY